MSRSPIDRVLSTYELLESILSNLDMKDLLLFQRVSKSFKSVIDRSNDLQQKLFFQPIPHERGTKAAVVINLFALRALGCPDSGDFANHTYGFHIWVFRMAAPVDTVGHGSWRNMLLFQPACDGISLALKDRPAEVEYHFRKGEQRLGTVVDAIKYPKIIPTSYGYMSVPSRFQADGEEGQQLFEEVITAAETELALNRQEYPPTGISMGIKHGR